MRNENVQPLEVQPYLEEMNPIIEHECEQSKLQINQFKRILQNMGKFIKDVEKIKVDPEDSVIYKYCGAQPYLVLSSATVVDLLQKRIQKQLIDKIRMIKNKKIKRNWSEEDLKILFWVVNHYALFQKIESIQKMSIHNWESISSLIPGTTGVSCMFRILSLKKTKLSQQQWTEQQSNLLYDIVDNKEIIDWKIISEDLFLKNRSPNKIFRNAKQCKEHWSCFLNPKLRKGPWQLSQDLLLLQKIVQNNGKKRWTQLAKYFQGRTENALKNRFCLIIERAKLECTRKEELYLIETALQNLKIKKQAGLQQKKNKKSYFSPSTLTLEFESNSKIEEKKVVLEKNCRNNKIQKLNLSQDLQAITLSNNQFLSAMLAGTKFFLLFNQPNLPA